MYVKDLVWLRKLLIDMGHPCVSATNLYIDNQSAIKLVKNPEYHKRTKHVDVQYHYIREKYECKVINVIYVPTDHQLADIFTNPVIRNKFEKFRNDLNIVKISFD